MMRARASLHNRHFPASAQADSSIRCPCIQHPPSSAKRATNAVQRHRRVPSLEVTSNFNWQAEGVGLAHKYAEPQDVDVTVANAGGGAVLYHVLTLQARQILAQSQLSSVACLPNALSGVQPPAYFQAHTDVVAQAEISSKSSNHRQDTPSASGVADSTRQKVEEGPDTVSGRQSLGRHGMGVEDTPRPHTQPAAPQAEGGQRAVRRSSTLIMKEATQPTLSSIQPLMVVADSRGRVCHVTLKMAELLGRSVEALRANGMEHAFSALLPEPFSHMHHNLLQATASSVPPPHSCRSGLIQLLQRTSGQGQTEAVPFQLQIKRRTGVETVYHVATFTEATMEQALDERRLLLEVDADGLITGVSSGTPASLFALDPSTLPGLALDAVLDFMHPTTAQDGP
ncbi:PAS domain-containing protein [Haematococcus lacustris]|uniref:PAS domain-containing protein n=1 Tax=Haematococcus lacustris TaxID=44745 RepID=A0A699YTL6_HAELA|nr:PAS domain-containing protein [Haematococcus lacustris]